MKAIVVQDNKAIIQSDRPIPRLRDDYILVKTVAIAINPTDWKHIERGLADNGCLVGCDFAGIVENVGKHVTKLWSKGERVAGFTHGGNPVQPEDGAFAEYIVAKGDVQMKIPESLSFDSAASFPLGAATVMQGLYQKALKMNLPDDPIKEQKSVLIYGGSTATGALGLQFAKLSGYTVLSTCSTRNFDYVKNLGADKVFDYRDVDVGLKIREATHNKLTLAWDTVNEEKSAQICAEALSSESADCRYGSFVGKGSPREDIECIRTLVYTIFGESFVSGPLKVPANLEDFQWAKKFMTLTEKLLVEGKLLPHKVTLREGGLEGALQGLDDLKNNRVSGEKLVYKVADML